MQRERGRSPGVSAKRSSQRSHHERTPLSEVGEGAVVDGVVTWANPRSGVFVDFGATKDGRLKVPQRHNRLYSRGMQVRSMTVAACDPDAGRVTLLPDPDEAPESARGDSAGPGPSTQASSAGTPRRRRSRGSSRPPSSRPSRSPSTGRSSRSVRRRTWDHPDGLQLAEVDEGKVVDGVVTGANRFGVFVNFGSVKDGRLMIHKRFHREFKVGDQLPELRVQRVDLRRLRVGLAVVNLEATLEHLKQERVPLEELEEGRIVDGIICGVGPFGVFVNIGAVKDGKLMVPKHVQLMMLSGEVVQGMRIVKVDLELQRVTLAFDDAERRPAERERGRPDAPAPRAASDAGTRPPPRRAPSPSRAPEDAPVPLEDIRKGELADGIVVSKTSRGVLVDVGAAALGTLDLPAETRQHFQINDMVEGMVVEDVDLRRRQVVLSMDDPELAVLDGRPYAIALDAAPAEPRRAGAAARPREAPPRPREAPAGAGARASRAWPAQRQAPPGPGGGAKARDEVKAKVKAKGY